MCYLVKAERIFNCIFGSLAIRADKSNNMEMKVPLWNQSTSIAQKRFLAEMQGAQYIWACRPLNKDYKETCILAEANSGQCYLIFPTIWALSIKGTNITLGSLKKPQLVEYITLQYCCSWKHFLLDNLKGEFIL